MNYFAALRQTQIPQIRLPCMGQLLAGVGIDVSYEVRVRLLRLECLHGVASLVNEQVLHLG